MKTTRARIALAGIVLTTAAALSGCSIIDQFLPSSQPVRDAETGEVTEQNDNADVFSIQVGDCLNTAEMASAEEVSNVPVVPCAEPHDDEVYHAYDLTGDAYPGEEAIIADADVVCQAEFATFVGLPYEESALLYWPIYPTEGSWGDGDREVLCAVYEDGAKVTGSLAGVAR